MAIISASERQFLQAATRAGLANPFTEDLLDAEREALGDAFAAESPIWSLDVKDP